MRVLVTGGTGFVGSHTVAALVRAGHDVHLLVRSPARIAPALEPLGVTGVSHAVGDITDAPSVAAAMGGCEAVVHAASVFSYDVRQVAEIARVNVPGTEIVLGEAAHLGLDPIVYVSSFVALVRRDGSMVSPASDVGDFPLPYTRSKADAERVARRYAETAPVVITYPGAVWGPHDPYLQELNVIAKLILQGIIPFYPRGTLPFADVRDVAAVHAALMEPGKGSRRFVVAEPVASFEDLAAALAEVTGRRVRARTIGATPMRLQMRFMDLLQRISPVELPGSFEGAEHVLTASPADASAVRTELGIQPRSLVETARDTVAWMVEAGHLSPRRAGVLGRSVTPAQAR